MKKIQILLLVLFSTLCIGPLVFLLLQVKASSFSLLLANDLTKQSILGTIILSFCVSSLCLLIGFPLAWLVERTDIPISQRLKSWLMLPYIIPPYIGAIAWISLANPQSGFLNILFGTHGFNIYSWTGLVFIESSFLFTYVFMTTASALSKMDSSLEESARICGANHFQVFCHITVPILKPALVNGFLLVFLSTAASFGVPAMIGGPARLHFITTQIFAFQRLGTENGLLMSIAFSSLLMVSSLLLFFGLKLFDDIQKVSMVGGKSSRPSLVELGKLKVPVLITILSFLFIVLIMPFLSLLFSSLSETQGVISLTNIGFKNFSRILFSTEETPRAFYNSFLLSISAGLVITILSFFTAYVQSRSDNKTRNWIEGIVNLPFSTPGTILAISMILVFSQSFWGRWSLYNSLGLLLVAYILKFFSLSLKTLTESFSQIHQSLEEAAQLCGASRFRILIDIYFPILRPALFATFFLIMMPCLSELTMTLLLSGPGQETLGILIYQLQEYSDMGGGGAAVISTLILTFILCFNLAYHLLQERRSIA